MILVVDKNKQPLDPCHPARARELLSTGRAAVFRHKPFTIILKDRVLAESVTHDHTLKIDPGSKVTGIAVLQAKTNRVVFAAELQHRGQTIKAALEARRLLRSNRRARHTRYRQARFLNRKRPAGWLAPSLQHRVLTTLTWVRRLARLMPVGKLAVELVRFDLQKEENPEIAGVEYQQGELAGYEVREYLLEKWNRTCAYCSKKDVPLEIEHIVPKSKGGSNRVSNLTLACHPCNQKKDNQDLGVFLVSKPELVKRILSEAKAPLKDAAAVNSTRWALFSALKVAGFQVEVGSGGRTKFNRIVQGFAKTHWLDAACVGASTPPVVKVEGVVPLLVKATGHGSRQVCGTNKYGFPFRHKARQASFFGFQTGDRATAIVTSGKKVGTYIGRVICRATGKFDISTSQGLVQGLHNRFFKKLQRKDGYFYA
jgi:5-methylcytosine-specific restriction endonuclease McrA